MFRKVGLIITLSSLLGFANNKLATAQEIKIDGSTATIVTKDGNHVTIDGTTLSGDGKNLFHSFQEFGLSKEQIATFLTNSNIQNILSRVTGGNPSYLNGLIEVIGGNSNLFLMNPAGIVFGQGASLNVPADFTATTSTGISFNNAVFQAIAENNYQELVGSPTGFIFNSGQNPGSIINAGDLKLTEGANLTLIGGNVINTGTIETPHGRINIQAVGDGSTVKITPEGSILGLIVQIPTDDAGNLLGFTVKDLPTLLTGAKEAGVETPRVAVNPVTGKTEVARVPIPNESGISIVSGKLETSSNTATGGEITVLGPKVGVIEGKIEANGAIGGGKVLIGGDRQGQGTIPNSVFTYVSPDSEISASAKVNGNGGEIIVFASDHASIHGKLTAQGGSYSGDGGLIETSGLNSFSITTVPDTSAINGNGGEWLIDPHNLEIVDGNSGINLSIDMGEFTASGDDSQVGVFLIESALLLGDVTISTGTTGVQEGNITWNSGVTLNYDGSGTGKTLTLKAANNIIYNGIIIDSDTSTTDSLNVVFNSDADANQVGAIAINSGSSIVSNGGNLILGGGNEPSNTPAFGTSGLENGVTINGILNAGEGNITITGAGGAGTESDGVQISSSGIITTTGLGEINIDGTGGTGVDSSGFSDNEGVEIWGEISTIDGNINITGAGGAGSQDDLNTQDISTEGGKITLTTQTDRGNLNTGNLNSNGGEIGLFSQGDIKTDEITSSGNQGQSGNITIDNTQGTNRTITTGNIDSSGNQTAGNVTIKSQGDIEFSSIDARSSGGSGGTVLVETPTLIRGTGFIPDPNDVTVSSVGINGDDSVTLKYDGDESIPDAQRTPFIVGDASINGTAGAIQSSQGAIEPNQSFLFTEIRGNVSIISIDAPPTVAEPPTQPTKLELAQKDPDPTNNQSTPVPPIQDNVAINQIENTSIQTIPQAQKILNQIEQVGTEKPALIYVSFTPKGYQPVSVDDDFARREALNTQEYQKIGIYEPDISPRLSREIAPEDQLDILIITSKDEPVRITVPVTRQEAVESATNLWRIVSDAFALDDSYKPYAAELYGWLVAPLEDKLQEREINNLLFILPPEMRLIPIAALYDENKQQFLVEKYSSGLAPSLNLNDNRYRNLKDMKLLAMGASQFEDPNVVDLPAVGLELPTVKKIWDGTPLTDESQYLNDNFTFDNLKSQLSGQPYGIIHLGTHGEFNPGQLDDSYIQLYNSRLGLSQIRNLGLNDPLVELLVLSACETAFGNEEAELGFAGLAVQAGVKTAMGSVWQVSDTGTLALMADFYNQLKTQSTKAEALRQAQLNMLKRRTYKTEDGNQIVTPELEISLQGFPVNSRQSEDFSHPFYWAPFTMIGNPW
jgi:filamentous hemagglutinin family protein